jgi:hypothetical protein
MVAEALVAIVVAMSAAPSKVARTRMTPIPQPPKRRRTPFKQLTMRNGSPKIDLERHFQPFSENTGGTRKLLAQLENLVLRAGLSGCGADRISGTSDRASLKQPRAPHSSYLSGTEL